MLCPKLICLSALLDGELPESKDPACLGQHRPSPFGDEDLLSERDVTSVLTITIKYVRHTRNGDNVIALHPLATCSSVWGSARGTVLFRGFGTGCSLCLERGSSRCLHDSPGPLTMHTHVLVLVLILTV